MLPDCPLVETAQDPWLEDVSCTATTAELLLAPVPALPPEEQKATLPTPSAEQNPAPLELMTEHWAPAGPRNVEQKSHWD